MDIRGIIEALVQSNALYRAANNPLAQFGQPQLPYLGASLLPERMVPNNEYTESNVRYRTIVANDSTRYSPVQRKRGVLVGSFRVTLADSDIGSDFTAADYDEFLRLLAQSGQGGQPTMEAMASLLNWADLTLIRPLMEKNEKMRWEAIVDASVVRTGDNGFTETVGYSNPTGHRAAASIAWSNDANDPYDDIQAGVEKLASKGYTASRCFCSSSVRSKLMNNLKMQNRVGRINVAAGTTVGLPGRLSASSLNAILAEDGVPPIEVYDRQYRTQSSYGYFLKRDVFVIVGTTGQDLNVDLGDPDQQPLLLTNTVGYTGIGRAAGQSTPGRRVLMTPFENKPPRIEGEAWQTSLPVITEPESIFVVTGIT